MFVVQPCGQKKHQNCKLQSQSKTSCHKVRIKNRSSDIRVNWSIHLTSSTLLSFRCQASYFSTSLSFIPFLVGECVLFFVFFLRQGHTRQLVRDSWIDGRSLSSLYCFRNPTMMNDISAGRSLESCSSALLGYFQCHNIPINTETEFLGF